jgi:hypothetical protein
MTPVFCCGFECGQFSSNTVGAHWQVPTGAIAFDTTIKRNGERSLRANPSAAATDLSSKGSEFPSTIYVLRGYVYFTTLPTTNDALMLGSLRGGALFSVSDNKIYAVDGAFAKGATGISVSTDRWYRLDVKIDVSANPWLIDVKVDGIDCGQKSTATAANSNAQIRVLTAGGGISWSGDVYLDDIIASTTSADYPIGNGVVNHFIPTSDGTHNVAGAADFRRGNTTTDITNATTTAWQLIDKVPLDPTTAPTDDQWIRIVAPPNATDYVECVFGPASGISTPTVAPRAVEVIAEVFAAGTGLSDEIIKLNDNGTLDNIYDGTQIAGVVTGTYKKKHYATAPSTGAAWTVALFNALRMRYGFATDANPDKSLMGIMIEAEFPEPKQKIVQVEQAIKRSNYY